MTLHKGDETRGQLIHRREEIREGGWEGEGGEMDVGNRANKQTKPTHSHLPTPHHPQSHHSSYSTHPIQPIPHPILPPLPTRPSIPTTHLYSMADGECHRHTMSCVREREGRGSGVPLTYSEEYFRGVRGWEGEGGDMSVGNWA